MAEFASKGIAGTVGLVQNLTGGNGLGGLLGGGNNAQSTLVMEQAAKIAALEAEKYADAATQNTRDRIAALNKDVLGYVVDLGQKAAVAEERNNCLASKVTELQTFASATSKEISAMLVREAENNKDVQCLAKTTTERLDALRTETRQAIALESERRVNGDQNLMCYVNATFVPGKLVMPKTSVCPEPMDAKNAWVTPNSCGCGCSTSNS